MTRPVLAAYLDRLAIGDPGPPSVESLFRLHRAHVERVAYDNLDIQLGRPAPIDPTASVERIAGGGRGGYCFHLNGAFSELLRALGYDVARHLGGVQRTHRDPAAITGAHMAVTVRGLPDETCPDGAWMVDVGLGSALHEPLPLRVGAYRQGPFVYGLRPSSVEHGAWRFEHAAGVAFVGMDFGGGPADIAAFGAMHEHLSSAADSPFVRVATVQRRHADGVDVLRGAILTRLGAAPVTATIERSRDWFEAIADVFGLPLRDLGPDAREALWRRVTVAHEQYVASHARRA